MSFASRDNAIKLAVTFVIATGLLAVIPYYFAIEFGLRRYYVALLMWTPAFGAFATCVIHKINIRDLAWRWPSKRYLTGSYLTPVGYALIAYGIVWISGNGGLFDAKYVNELGYIFALPGWSEISTVIFGMVMFGTIGMLWHLITSFGEELGWRGFLTPVLMQKFSFAQTSIITGIVWALWHVPLILYTDYNAGPTGLAFQMINFSIMLIAMSFIMTYFVIKSGSHWPATIMHAAHNVYILNFQGMTIKYDATRFYAGEFGILLPIVTAVIAAYFWYRYKSESNNSLVEEAEGDVG